VTDEVARTWPGEDPGRRRRPDEDPGRRLWADAPPGDPIPPHLSRDSGSPEEHPYGHRPVETPPLSRREARARAAAGAGGAHSGTGWDAASGPSTGGISAAWINTGGIPTERLQADRLHGDPLLRDLVEPGGHAGPPPESLEIAALIPSTPSPERDHGRRPRTRSAEVTRRTGRGALFHLLVTVLVVGLLVVGGAWLMTGPLHRGPGATTASTALPQQQLILVGLTDGPRASAMLLVGSGPGYAAAIPVPPSLLVDDGKGGRTELGATAGAGVTAPAQALARTLGLRVDATWLLTTGGLAKLVDGNGGVVVDVGQEIRSGTVLVAAGRGQRLTGAQAIAYVTVKLDGEGAQSALDRFAAVVGQVMTGLPGQPPAAAGQLGGLGPESTSSDSRDDLAARLLSVAQQLSGGNLTTTQFPATPAGAGQPADALVADRAAVADLVRQTFGGNAAASATSGS
jgi:hypothetical protein